MQNKQEDEGKGVTGFHNQAVNLILCTSLCGCFSFFCAVASVRLLPLRAVPGKLERAKANVAKIFAFWARQRRLVQHECVSVSCLRKHKGFIEAAAVCRLFLEPQRAF